jgi:hypothetical protein
MEYLEIGTREGISKMRIGVIGYSGQAFDEVAAQVILEQAFSVLGPNPDYMPRWWIVSGYTNLGIPKMAYAYAQAHNFRTMGIACVKAKDYECFPCERVFIVGQEWGDESEAFLAAIDILIRIGGGKQSEKETEMARERGIPIFEYAVNGELVL